MRVWRRPLTIAGYFFYALALFVAFAYLKFPGQEARAMALTGLSRLGLDHVYIEAIHPLLLAGVAFRDIRYSRDVDGQSLDLLRAPEFRVYWRTFVPFADSFRLRFEGELYGGDLSGTIEWQQNRQDAVVEIQGYLREIRPGIHPAVARLGKTTIDGTLLGNLALRVPKSAWKEGQGQLTLKGDAGRITGLEFSGVQLPALPYEQLSAEVVWQMRHVVVRELSIQGRDWQLDVQGKVNLTNHLPASTLDLTMRVRAMDNLEQQLGLIGTVLKQRRDRRGFSSFRIAGTLGQPNIAL
jgi:type II secretion system protein N